MKEDVISNAYSTHGRVEVAVANPKGKRRLGRPRHKEGDNTEMCSF
jgi:hypothetical protein